LDTASSFVFVPTSYQFSEDWAFGSSFACQSLTSKT